MLLFPEVRRGIADDHDIVRRGVCTLIENHSGGKFVGNFESPRQVLETLTDA
jgi:DNA-binding NarL/FixJ family response regulator